MDTRSSSELKKALDNLEAEKREMADQMKKLQDHIRDLTMTGRRHQEESSFEDTPKPIHPHPLTRQRSNGEL
ncbi:hypothetical protein E3N88_42282 [Mikania micrantha]|uniref:Uncharacterized protein n=1 Tax=Mikania micrantha TaxID=192012 RepID=A0A5N6LI73_9ASTR|nr:hypothetical protein E3N88_42282 [Mikania micrantha]